MPRQRKLNKHLNEVRYIPNQPKTLYYLKKMTFRADISYGTRCWQITRTVVCYFSLRRLCHLSFNIYYTFTNTAKMHIRTVLFAERKKEKLDK